jgi:hypothetical protein
MAGSASFSFMSRLPSLRHPRTAAMRLRSPSARTAPSAAARCETKAMPVAPVARPIAPNMGRM